MLVSFIEYFQEHFMMEDGEHPDPFEATFAKHRDAIMSRAKEIDHFEVRSDGMSQHTIHAHPAHYAPEVHEKFNSIAKHFQNGEREKEFPGGHVQPGHRLAVDPYARTTVRAHYADDSMIAHSMRNTQNGEYADHAAYHDQIKNAFKQTVTDAAPRAKYIPKIMKMYANGSIKKIEDIGTQAKDTFADYDKLVTQGHIRTDLQLHGTTTGHHQLKKMNTLNDVREVVTHPAYKEALKKAAPPVPEGESHIEHDDEHGTVHSVDTHAAMVALSHCPHTGEKAHWCIGSASKEGAALFDEHGDKDTPYPGLKLVFHPKQPKYPGEMHCVVPMAKEYRDKEDEEVPYSESDHDGGIQKRGERGARYPGFGHKEIMAATYKHAYEKPHLYPGDAQRELGEDRNFAHYVHSRNPYHDKSMWRQKTPEEREAGKIGNSAAHLFDTVPKDNNALMNAHRHHNHVTSHFFPPEEHDPEDYNEDR